MAHVRRPARACVCVIGADSTNRAVDRQTGPEAIIDDVTLPCCTSRSDEGSLVQLSWLRKVNTDDRQTQRNHTHCIATHAAVCRDLGYSWAIHYNCDTECIL